MSHNPHERRQAAIARIRSRGQLEYDGGTAWNPENAKGWQPVPDEQANSETARPHLTVNDVPAGRDLTRWGRWKRWYRSIFRNGRFQHDNATALSQLRQEIASLQREMLELTEQLNQMATEHNRELADLRAR